ncbi:Retrovirus-related Pol polyprotein from transposon TNT 1-94 [Vitis vinifera]|uniref:Retrovirus-related Pol polyprotein from transposon TNT 1-94 n=1 Tax=Vitis vinifera TaxID=29760 RepID=A0A438IVD6_VITVI|nr:Retrovirus-related Pol polyprotein from transposon TNT 1-94 [Vitis vinifera]
MKQGKVKEKKNDNGGEDDQVATTTSDSLLFMIVMLLILLCQETSWVIDSGASIHATPRKDFFTSYTSGDFGSVRMGNDGSAKAIGMGDVRLETSNGTMLTLKNVKHIPDIRMNLISTGKLDDEGFCNTFRDSQWKLARGSMVIAKGNKSSSLYLMQARVIDSSINAVDDDSTFELWHNRLGHMRKQTRVAFKTLRHTRKPDDHSRKIWVYTLKTKDQVLDVFKQFHALVERQSGEKLKCIRTDNGGEYSGPFDEYCRQHDIRHQKTPPKTPQLNGLAERMNRTLVERNLMFRIEFGQIMKSLMITCVSLDARLLCIFPKMRDLSLDVKTRPCVFIGYGQDELGYRFYDPVQKKLVRSEMLCLWKTILYRILRRLNPMESQHSGDLIDLDLAPLKIFLHRLKMKHMMTNMTWVMLKHPHKLRWMMMFMSSHQQQRLHQIFPLRRFTRDRHPSTRYSVDDYVLLTDGEEPESYVEAMKDENKMKWVDAMRDEMEVKQEEHTSQPRYKARLVVKGFNQKKGIDFDEIFSPVVKMSSIRVVLGLAASLDLEIQQMDVKTAFLHGDLDKEIYMEQPEGFVLKGKEDYVCKLKKSLYGLKQAPRQWYKKFESVMGEQGYRKTTSDHCVFVQKFSDDDFVILLLYVDDILIVGRNVSRIDNLKKQLSKSFAMKDLGPVLAKFNMSKAKVVSSPLASHFKLSSRHNPSTDKEKEDMRRLVLLAGFLSNPGRHHWEAVKWIMRYLRGISKLKLTFGSGKPILVGYTDSDMAGDVDNRRSTSSYLMTFSGGAVSWQSRLQKCVALSTTEAEYIAAAEACKELLWMKCFMQELRFKQQRYVVYCDNQNAIHLSKNSSYHARSKHIDVRYHWMRDALNNNLVLKLRRYIQITMARIC